MVRGKGEGLQSMDIPVSRKQDFRELKQLHREEMKEATEFYAKIKEDRELHDKKRDVEISVSTALLGGVWERVMCAVSWEGFGGGIRCGHLCCKLGGVWERL